MGPVDFDDARRIVREHLLDQWTARNGTLQIENHGFKDEQFWRVIAGTAPGPYDEAEEPVEPLPPEARAYLVERSTGRLEVVTVQGNEARLAGMLPWGVRYPG